MKLRRISFGLSLVAATAAVVLAVSGPATAQDSGKDVLRIGWSQDPIAAE